jgi:hypothetical protein
MGEIQYIWADPSSSGQQIALSSIVQAMKGHEDGTEKELYAIARWVTRDGADPKMGVLAPCVFEKVDCLLWAQVGRLARSLRELTKIWVEFRCLLRTTSESTHSPRL